MQSDGINEPKNGFIRMELDNELIQGAKLEVTYEIKATNKSEVDYIPIGGANPVFYQYGSLDSQQPITIRPTGIMDYLDKNWSFDGKIQTTENTWEVKTIDKIKDDVIEEVWKTETTETTNKPTTEIQDKMILYTETLKDKRLVAKNAQNNKDSLKQSETVDLKVSKILTTTDEISLKNEAEEVKVTRDGGRTLQTTPGNYIPGGGGNPEPDDSTAETTIITPATGEDLSYMIPIAIGITAFIILGTGIIIIKKKVI